MQVAGKISLKGYSLLLSGLRNFVARRIYDHTRMVIVFVHHVLHILLPPFSDKGSVVILSLVHIPAVDILVHHEHSEPVADLQLIFGARVVCRADRIIAGRFEDRDTALLSLGVCAGTQETVVVMYAGAADYDPLPVNCDSLIRCPCQCADAERQSRHIVAKSNTRFVKVRCIYIPEFCVRNFNYQFTCSAGGGNGVLTVKNFNKNVAGHGCLHSHTDLGREDR